MSDTVNVFRETGGQCMALEGPLTLDQIGARMGLSRERVRQIEESGKQRMRDGLAQSGLSPSDIKEALAPSMNAAAYLDDCSIPDQVT